MKNFYFSFKFSKRLYQNPSISCIIFISRHNSSRVTSRILKEAFSKCDTNFEFNYSGLLDNNKVLKRQRVEFYDLLYSKLLEESGINVDAVPKNTKKGSILNCHIGSLKNEKLLDENVNVTQQLLSHLPKFPFDPNLQKYGKDENSTSIKKLRDAIERQYAAYRFNIDIKLVSNLFKKFQPSFYTGRSMQSIHRNLNQICSSMTISYKNVDCAVFLLGMQPLTIDTIRSCKSGFCGLKWGHVADVCPRFLKLSYQHMQMLESALLDARFTSKQIQKGLPSYSSSFVSLVKKIAYICAHPKFNSYKSFDRFLLLPGLSWRELDNVEPCNWLLVHKALNKLPNVQEKETEFTKLYMLHYRLLRRLNISDSDFVNLCRHPKLSKAPYSSIRNTIDYLQQKFSNDEIIESLPIILYPRSSIEQILQRIKNDEFLQEIGFKNGRVAKPTRLFPHGTVLKNKKLQLCLYYMEKPLHFSGSGVFT